MSTSTGASALNHETEKLCALGGHLVRCQGSKEPTDRAWQKTAPTAAAAADWLISPDHLLGLIPASIGCCCVDLDSGGLKAVRAVLAALRPPVAAVVPTRRRGGYHIWVRAAPTGNRKWAIEEGGGDIRSARGYAVLWGYGADSPLALWRGGQPTKEKRTWAEWAEMVPQLRPVALGALFTPPLRGGVLRPAATVGARNDTLNREVFLASGDTAAEAEAVEKARRGGLPEREIQTTVASARAAALAKAVKSGDAAEGGDIYPDKGRATLEDVLRRMGVAARYDIRGQVIQFRRGLNQGKWVRTNDRLSAALRDSIAARYWVRTTRGPVPLRFGADSWMEAINAYVAKNEVDPFAEWLVGVPEWDGVERIGALLAQHYGAPDTPLNAWASRFLFLGPVERAHHPGAKLDEMPVLVGKQGIGKSALLRSLLPPEHPEWFADGLHLADAPQHRAEALQGRVIVEAAEMAGSTRADLESLKAFISRQDDGAVRLAYRRDPEVLLRRSIIVGTTNDSECLPNDPTGNRRFVPVECTRGVHIEPLAETLRLQWWAEAVSLYGRGERAPLPRSLQSEQGAAALAHRRQDELMELAIRRIRPVGGTTLAACAQAAGLVSAERAAAAVDPRLARRLSSALRGAGWSKRREVHDGTRGVYWYPPEDWYDPEEA